MKNKSSGLKNYIIMERVNGDQHDDKEHDQLVISKLFEYAIESPMQKSETYEITYLQHGDVKRNNILWTNVNDFVFIDIDNISYRPLLFDVLHYCAMAGMNLDEVLKVLDLHKHSIKKLFLRCDICFGNDYLDLIFYDYTMFFVRLGDCYEDIAFLINGETDSYPRTEDLLNKYFNKEYNS